MYLGKHYSLEEIKFLEQYANSAGYEFCAKCLNRSTSSVYNRVRRLGITYCKKPKEDIDLASISFKNSFIDLDLSFETQKNPKELAYFLGYFWADGYINPQGGLFMEIAENDLNEIKPILLKLASFSVYRRERANRQPQATFYMKGRSFCKQLKSLGKYSHSLESHKKILEYIPSKYHVYFFRGLIDGDGCFYFNDENGTYQITISNSFGFDWDYLVSYFKKRRITFRIRNTLSDHGNSSAIRCTTVMQIKKLIEWLYKTDDGIWLTRKHNKAIDMLNSINRCKSLTINNL